VCRIRIDTPFGCDYFWTPLTGTSRFPAQSLTLVVLGCERQRVPDDPGALPGPAGE
jgi:hypothetical protein